MKRILSLSLLLLAPLAMGATVPRLFPEGVKLETIQAKGANGVKVKNSSGTDVLTVSDAGAASIGALTASSLYQRFNLGNNGASYPPTTGVAALHLGGNQSNSGAEVDFINSLTSATTAFKWYQQTGASALTDLGSVSSASAWTLGTPAGGITHGFYGGLRTLSSETTLADGMNVANKFGISTNNTTGNIQGFVGGVAGQILYIRMGGSGSATLVQAGTGTQKFRLPGGLNLSLTALDGAILLCDGTDWVVLGHTK